MTNTVQITLWLVGTTADDAQANFPFDSAESARSCADDNPGTRVFIVAASIDLATVEPVDPAPHDER